MTTWDEIQKLATELQSLHITTQVSRESVPMLSQSHCIELVNMITSRGMIDVVYTLDGKTYVTTSKLKQEITEYCQKKKRVNRNLIHSEFNVSKSIVEKLLPSILADSKNGLSTLRNDIISRDYFEELAESIEELVSVRTCLSVSEISEKFELAPSVVRQVIGTNLLGKPHLIFDNENIYNHFHISKYAAVVKGALQGSLLPVDLKRIKEFNFIKTAANKEILDGLICDRQGDILDRITYIYYSKNFIERVVSLLNGQDIIHFSFLETIGMRSPDMLLSLVSQMNDKLIRMTSCFVRESFMKTLASEIDDNLKISGYFELPAYLSETLDGKDISEFCSLCARYSGSNDQMVFIPNDYVLSTSMYANLRTSIESYALEKAEEIRDQLKEHTSGSRLKEKDNKNTLITKSIDISTCDYKVNYEDFRNFLQSTFQLPQSLGESLAHHFAEELKKNVEKLVQTLHSTLVATKQDTVKDYFKLKQEKLKKMIIMLKVLHEDLLKIKNFVCTKDPEENMPEVFTAEKRMALISTLDSEKQKMFKSMIGMLKLERVDDFMVNAVPDILHLAAISRVVIKEPSSGGVREEMLDESRSHLSEVDDLAKALHCCAVILYHAIHGAILTVPGKSVCNLISATEKYLSKDDYTKLKECYARVLVLFKEKKNCVIVDEGNDDYEKLKFLKHLGLNAAQKIVHLKK